MAQPGRSARETREEIEAYRSRLARQGRRLTIPRPGATVWALLWLGVGVIITIVSLPLLPERPNGWIADLQGQVVDIKDTLTGSSDSRPSAIIEKSIVDETNMIRRSTQDATADLIPKLAETEQTSGGVTTDNVNPGLSPPRQESTGESNQRDKSQPVTSVVPTPETFSKATSNKPQLGPLVVKGLYCWYRDADSSTRLRFAVYNPSEEEVTVRTNHGPMRLNPGVLGMSDPLDISDQSSCRYTLDLELGNATTTVSSTPSPSSLASGSAVSATSSLFIATSINATSSTTSIEFAGVEIASPVAELEQLMPRLFDDLERADLDSIESYIDPNNNVDLVALIAWRSYIRPVRTIVDRCDLRFELLQPEDVKGRNAPVNATSTIEQPDSLAGGKFSPAYWECSVTVQYATTRAGPGSGIWELKGTQEVVSGDLTLIPTHQP